MKWRVTDQQIDQRGLGERLWKKTINYAMDPAVST